MSTEGRIMSLDVGTVRIGVALTDPLAIIASPHDVIQASSTEEDVEAVRRIVEDQEVRLIVVGLPLDQNGNEGPQAQKIRSFIDDLTKVIDIEIVTQDERFTTASAERMLISANVSRKGRKKVIDKIAAQHILQDYLDRQHALKKRSL